MAMRVPILVGSAAATLVLSSLTAATSPPGAAPVELRAVQAGSVSPLSVPLNDCVVPDNGLPEIAATEVVPSTVDLRHGPVKVSVRVLAVDTGGPGAPTGVSDVSVYASPLERRSDSRFPGWSAGETQARPTLAADGWWTETGMIYPGATTGRWEPHLIELTDGVGLMTQYLKEDLDRHGVMPGFTVVGPTDKARPRLVSMTLGRRAIDLDGKPGSVRVTVRAKDDLYVQAVGAVAVNRRTGRDVGVHLDRVRLSDGRHAWRGRIPFRAWNDNGAWSLGAVVRDGADKYRYYGTIGDGMDHGGLDGMRVDVTGGGRDRDRPRLTGISVAPSSVDVRTVDGEVTVTVRATDDVSGVASVVVEAFPEEAGSFGRTSLRRVAGSAHSGTWQATVPVSRCLASTGSIPWTVSIRDRVRRETWIGRVGRLSVLAADHQRPGWSTATYGSKPRNGPLMFGWTEDVAGISPDTAQLRPDLGYSVDRGSVPPVPGSWFCQQANGAAVDCAAGPVRTAMFLPGVRLDGPSYVMQFNPPHVLAVTDLAGNPASSWSFEPE